MGLTHAVQNLRRLTRFCDPNAYFDINMTITNIANRGLNGYHIPSLLRVLVCAAIGILCSTGVMSAKDVVVIAEGDAAPVEGAGITMYDAARDSIGNTLTDSRGRAAMLQGSRYALAQHDLFVPRMVTLSEGETTDTIKIKKATEIEELVVEGSDNAMMGPHRSHYISREDMKRYINVLQSLNEIPNLMVMGNSQIIFEGKLNVKLLLNGVSSSFEEIRALDKDDILKVNTYSVAPARYRMEGYESVIDVITKSSLRGGNASVSIDQAPYPTKGDNSAAIFYNYKDSRFSAIYNNHNSHSTRFRQSEFLDYEFDGVQYYKHKEGLDSHSNVDDNSLVLGYQLMKPGSYLYNVKLTGSISRFGENLFQRVTSQSNPKPYDANNGLYTGSNNVVLSNYFEKALGDNGKAGLIVANLTLQRTNSNYLSMYKEFEVGGNVPTVDEKSKYDIQYSNAVANLVYYLPPKKWGSLSFSVYDGFRYSRYKEASVRTSQRENTAGAWAQYYGIFGKFTLMTNLGIDGNYIYASVNGNKQSQWRPSVMAHVYYKASQHLRLDLGYNYSTSAPSIAQLSQTNQWLDTKLIFHGNPNLHSYSYHNLSLRANFDSKYIDFSIGATYTNIPGRICENFQTAPDYMLETLINLDKYQEIAGDFSFTIKPLGTTHWTINAFGGVGLTKGSSPGYDWTGHRFQFMSSTSVNLEKWTIGLRYQYPGQVAVGQLIRPRLQSWDVSCYFRPIEDLSFGLSICCPFGKGWKESERTVDEAPVHMNTETLNRDRANLVSLLLEWNVSFGKNREKPLNQRINISTEENGVLRK